jgi:hypothetical protein
MILQTQATLEIVNRSMEKRKSIAKIVKEIGQQYFMYQPPGVMVIVTKKRNITITHRFFQEGHFKSDTSRINSERDIL